MNIDIDKESRVNIIDDKLTALQHALNLLSTSKEFTLTVFNEDNTQHVVFCDSGKEIKVTKNSIGVQMYMLDELKANTNETDTI